MAGGIDWFRWHHGSVTDPKFQLVARQAGASLPDVLAVWAYLLESASSAQERGNIGEIDCEAVDCMFGFPATETRTADILAAMSKRGLLEGERITAWEKRQPKRERPEDDTAAGRKRAQREREAAAANQAVADATAASQSSTSDTNAAHVTPCHATSHQKTPRGEERREENPSPPSVKKERPARAVAPPVVRPDDVDEQTWADWLKLRAAKKAPVTKTVLDGAAAEAEKAGMTLAAFLRVWCRRGSQGLEASWLEPSERFPSQGSRHSGFATKNYREGVEADGSFT